ncbi:MAG: LemA family protein [Planctomycetes bacterium]|nr:LemA family protein [Planctomycetota bacterium]
MRAGKSCPKCGESLRRGAKFCPACGEKSAVPGGTTMNFMKALLILVVLLIGCGVLVGGCALSGFNKARTLDELVESKWQEIDSQLQRRFDLIPNIVATIKGVTAQEKEVFLGIAEARTSYQKADTVNGKAKAAGLFQSALRGLVLNIEKYPNLKSNENFLKLQDTIEGTENRLTVARKTYNDSVRKLNTFVRRFPGSVYAGWAGVDKAEYFKVSEESKERPDVDFSGSGDEG